MPIIINSTYQPPLRYRNAHVQTVLPSLLRKIRSVQYQRRRVHTADGDFIDLDWSYVAAANQASTSLAVLCHGLEGSADRAYMMGMAQAFNASGIDAVAYNYRGCSGETNLQKKFYTAGATDDLQDVLDAINKQCRYQDIYLVGFSLGGNLVLKYGGEKGEDIDPIIKGIVAISAPCDLRSSSLEMLKFKNCVYSLRFLKMLLAKVREKSNQYPELKGIDLKSIRTLKQFDDQLTAPLAGYKDAEDYWYKASCIRELSQITIPTLIVNAADDPILGPECYPYQEACAHDFIFLEIPERGGHVGFMHRPNQAVYWHERRTVDFLLQSRGKKLLPGFKEEQYRAYSDY
jgi:predicted alpha/beta-fold hydrolase